MFGANQKNGTRGTMLRNRTNQTDSTHTCDLGLTWRQLGGQQIRTFYNWHQCLGGTAFPAFTVKFTNSATVNLPSFLFSFLKNLNYILCNCHNLNTYNLAQTEIFANGLRCRHFPIFLNKNPNFQKVYLCVLEIKLWSSTCWLAVKSTTDVF